MASALGHWVAGFTDGEGCFSLHAAMRKDGSYFNVTCAFSIKVRADDRRALELVREAIGAGVVAPRRVYRGSREQCTYRAASLRDLQAVVVFFNEHPLRAKKANDYALWREAVMLMVQVTARPLRPSGKAHGSTRWTQRDRARMAMLAKAIKEGRRWKEC